MNKYYSPIYGLVTEADPVTENGGLFLTHYLTLVDMSGGSSPFHHQLFNTKMQNALVKTGLYKRSAKHNDRTVSHDELSGMVVASSLLGTNHKSDITKYLFKNFGNYNATGKAKFYNPADFYAWFRLSGNFTKYFSGLFLLNYIISLVITANRAHGITSGKLIYMNELYALQKISFTGKLLWKYFNYKMTKQYGRAWCRELIHIYFNGEHSDHPLKKKSSQMFK